MLPSGLKLPSQTALTVALLLLIFATEMLVMHFVIPLFADQGPVTVNLVDSSILTAVLAATLWLLLRPLHKSAVSERLRYNLIKSQVVDAVVIVDDNGVIDSFNTAAEEIFGYSSQQMDGRPVADLFYDIDLTTEDLCRLTDDSTSHERSVNEYICCRRDGSRLTMEISISRLQVAGTMQFLLIMRDVTHRKLAEAALRESESRFRQIFEQSEDAIFFLKPGSCSVVEANATAEELFGYNREDLHTMGIGCLFSKENMERLIRIAEGLHKGEVYSFDRFSGRCKDGTPLTLSVRCRLITLQGSTVIHSTMRDISQQIKMEDEALQMQAKLIQANKMTSLGLMVSSIAHEINNPNNFIMTNAQLLERTWNDIVKILSGYYRENGDFLLGGLPYSEMEQHIPEMLSGINDGSRRIKEIINDLKGFVRNGRHGAKGSVDINQAVNSAVTIMQHQITRYTGNFHMDLAANLPPVTGDSQHLAQVFLNLLMNACQALVTPGGGIWVSTGYDAAEDKVSITIRDEGSGIPEELGRKILEPFFTTKLDAGGTGLGLFISHSIVKEHNGTLEYVTIPDKGTTFTVTLPSVRGGAEEPD